MRSNNHYEMREYNIDVLKDEDDLSLRAKGRPYPIYPSKGGLNASLLRDTIARFVPLSLLCSLQCNSMLTFLPILDFGIYIPNFFFKISVKVIWFFMLFVWQKY